MILNIVFIMWASMFSDHAHPENRDFTKKDYVLEFWRIDNTIEIIINDSLVFTSGVVDGNPNFKGEYTYYLGNHLTDGADEVIVRLYNGHKPYELKQDDKHWEIEYVISLDDKEYDYMWDDGDDNKLGLVFEEKYYL